MIYIFFCPSLLVIFVIFCQKAEEDLDHILWHCEFASSTWDSFFQSFGIVVARNRDICALIEKSLLNLPRREKGPSLWCARVYAILWAI